MFSFLEASHALALPLHLSQPSQSASGVSIDTRKLRPGDLFVALRGTRQDGHAYLEEAFRKGAAGALLDEKIYQGKLQTLIPRPDLLRNLLLSPEPQKSLADLAAWYRTRFEVTAVGITGSVGKTSTKEILSFLLRQNHSILANEGNLNNHLGLPMTLLELEPHHRFCVAELGASHSGEIRFLSTLLRPAAGILTQISPAHLEGFGSLEAIYDAKLELFEALPKGAPAVIPENDVTLFEKLGRFELNFIRVGTSHRSPYQISEPSVSESFVHFGLNGRHFAFPGIASFLVQNAAMAVAMAVALGLRFQEIPERWEGLKLPSGRFSERIVGEGIRVIDDSYNANPTSFEKALEAFEAIETKGRKFLVFADMLELGGDARRYHEELGKKIAACELDAVIAYGPHSAWSIETLRQEKKSVEARHFRTRLETAAYLESQLRPGDLILLKASRRMKIEEVLQGLEAKSLSNS